MKCRARLVAFLGLCGLLAGSGPVEAQGFRDKLRERLRARGERRSEELSGLRRHIRAGGRERGYLLHVPAGLDGREPVPLVLVFHGGTHNAKLAAKVSRFHQLADSEGFLVAYPEGVERHWSDGRGTTAPDKQGVDDVAFARALVERLAKEFPVDRGRVFATGMSNGGFFSHRLGCEAADLFAAIGPVIAPMASRMAASCRPSRPVSVVAIQGAADPGIPIDGGEPGFGEGGQVEPAEKTYSLWAQLDGCPGVPVREALKPSVEDGTRVEKLSWTGCREGAEVVFYRVEGMGHRWPGSEMSGVLAKLGKRKVGPNSKNIDATRVIWDFFKAHPRRIK